MKDSLSPTDVVRCSLPDCDNDGHLDLVVARNVKNGQDPVSCGSHHVEKRVNRHIHPSLISTRRVLPSCWGR